MNTSEFLMIAASVVPDRVALVCEGESRTFAELQGRVNRLANALQALAIAKGDKVAVMALNSIPYVESYYACAKLGAVFVPLNYRAKKEELAYMVNNSETKAIFVGERYLDLTASIRPQFETVQQFVCYDAKPEGMTSYEDLLSPPHPQQPFPQAPDPQPPP